MNKRRINRYRKGRSNSGVQFTKYIGIIVLAIVLGYITARFLIAPIIGYDTDVLKLTKLGRGTEAIDEDDAEDDSDSSLKFKQEKEDSTKSSSKQAEHSSEKQKCGSYVLQYGVFSDQVRAEKAVEDLESIGLKATVKKSEEVYKVISETAESKEAALDQLNKIKDQAASIDLGDVFVSKY